MKSDTLGIDPTHMRRLIVVLSAVLVLVVLALVIGASLLNVDRFRPRLQAELQQKLGVSVTVGQLHLNFFPLAVRVDGFEIAADPKFPSPHPFAKASQVYASAGLLSLIQGKPQIHQFTLQNPQIELIRNQAGIWNFSSLVSHDSKSTSTGNNSEFTVSDLSIVDGQVAVTDEHAHSPRAIYNHIDLAIRDFSAGKPFDVEASLHLQGTGKEQLSFKGTAGPLGSSMPPIKGRLTIEQVSIAALNAVAPGKIPPQTDGLISGNTDITSQAAETLLNGTLHLQNAIFRGGKISAPMAATYAISMNLQTDQLAIRSARLEAGPTTVLASGTIASGVTPAALNLHLRTANASIADLLHLAALFGASATAGDMVKGSLTSDLAVSGNANAPVIDGTVNANPLQIQNIVLTNLRSTLRMAGGVVNLAPLSAGVFGGSAEGTLSANTRTTPVECSVKMKLSGADTNALLSAVSSVRDRLYGALSADTNLSFAAGAGPDLARSLNGTLAFNVANGRLKGVNILNELSRIGKFANGSGSANSAETALTKLAGTLDIHSGVASTNNLTAAMQEGSLAAVGTLNLVNEGLNMHVNSVLGGGISKAVGGTGIGGFLNTALANNKGELVLPVLVTGTMEHPTFSPDVEAIAKMKLQRVLPTTGNPAQGAVGGLLGNLLGQPQKKQDNNTKQSPLKSILNGLGK